MFLFRAALIGALIGGALSGLGMLIARFRRPRMSWQKRPRRLQRFTVAGTRESAMVALRRLAEDSRFTLEAEHPEEGWVVLGLPITLTTFGFFVPVYLHPLGDGRLEVEVGIESRLVQVGPLVSRAHRDACQRIERVLRR